MLLNGLNFTFLTSESYAALILALIFTIITVAGFIYFLKHKNLGKAYNSVLALIFPAITIFCWIYLLMNLFSYSLGLTVGVSFACVVGYIIIALFVSLIVKTVKRNKEMNFTQNKQEDVEVDNEKTANPPVVKPLLIAEKSTVEEKKSEDLKQIPEKTSADEEISEKKTRKSKKAKSEEPEVNVDENTDDNLDNADEENGEEN